MCDTGNQPGADRSYDTMIKIADNLQKQINIMSKQIVSLTFIVEGLVKDRLNDIARRDHKQVLHTDSRLRYVDDSTGVEVARD